MNIRDGLFVVTAGNSRLELEQAAAALAQEEDRSEAFSLDRWLTLHG